MVGSLYLLVYKRYKILLSWNIPIYSTLELDKVNKQQIT
jgi:hypothetical protein